MSPTVHLQLTTRENLVSIVLPARWLAPDQFEVIVARHPFAEQLSSGGDAALVCHDLLLTFDTMAAYRLDIGDHESRPIVVPPSSSLAGRQPFHTATERRLSWKIRAWLRWVSCSRSSP